MKRLGKKEQAERTRKRILDAAIRLFARRGFASTSMADLAGAIDMTPGVLYWHFESKEDLLVATLLELQRRFAEELVDAAAGASGSSVANAKALIARVLRIFEKHPEYLVFVGVVGAEATDTSPRVEAALREAYGAIAMLAEGLFTRARDEGLAPADLDVPCAAQMFLGLFMGGILHQRLFRGAFPAKRALPTLEKLLLSAVIPNAMRDLAAVTR